MTRGQADFDPSAPPPFKIAEITDAIPKHCWVKNPWRSLSYAVRDIFVIFALAAIAKYSSTWYVWPFYWAAQGTMFWAVFVIGHDCGHGSFSDSRWLNSFVGHILHSAILVPFHGWWVPPYFFKFLYPKLSYKHCKCGLNSSIIDRGVLVGIKYHYQLA